MQAKRWHIEGAIDAYLAAGVPPEKLVLGLGTYGRTFKLAAGQQGDEPGKLAQTGAPAGGECTLSPGVLSYYEIARKLGGQQVRGACRAKGRCRASVWLVWIGWLGRGRGSGVQGQQVVRLCGGGGGCSLATVPQHCRIWPPILLPVQYVLL